MTVPMPWWSVRSVALTASRDRKSTRLNSSHVEMSYAVFCLKKKQAVGAVAVGPRPSLGKVVRHLEGSDDPAWKNLGAVMRSVSEMRLARLCFSPSGGQQIDAEGWRTVFTLGGLTLPDTPTGREDYS